MTRKAMTKKGERGLTKDEATERLKVEAERQRLEAEAAAAENSRLEAAAEAERQRLEAKAAQQRLEWGSEVATVAATALKVAGKTEHEARLYRFVRDGDTLTVKAKDGRGGLVKRQGDELFVSNQVTEADRDYFRAQGQALQQRRQAIVSPSATKGKTAGLER